MSEYNAEPDLEEAAILHLRGDGAVTALVAVDDIATKLRSTWAAGVAAVRVRRIGGLPTEPATGRLVRIRLQVEAFAATEKEAFDLAAQADLSLRQMRDVGHAGAVVTDVRKDLAITNSPDPDSDSERYLFGAVIYAHAA